VKDPDFDDSPVEDDFIADNQQRDGSFGPQRDSSFGPQNFVRARDPV